VTYNLGQIFL